jgi:hypothetical protein
MDTACCMHGVKGNACKYNLVWKARERSLGRHRRKWGNITGVVWTGLVWLRIEIGGGLL